VALGVGVVCLVSALVSLAFAVSWWSVVATVMFSVAYLVLWAEFRFPFFQHVPQETAGPRTHHTHHARRFFRMRRH